MIFSHKKFFRFPEKIVSLGNGKNFLFGVVFIVRFALFCPAYRNTRTVSRNPMKKSYRIIILLLISICFLDACSKMEDFESFNYTGGGFGRDGYKFSLEDDSTFALNVHFDPLFNEDTIWERNYKGKLDAQKMKIITNAVDKITKQGYDYNDPELAMDAGMYKVVYISKNSIKTFETHNATDKFRKDLIKPLDSICEDIIYNNK